LKKFLAGPLRGLESASWAAPAALTAEPSGRRRGRGLALHAAGFSVLLCRHAERALLGVRAPG